MTFFEKFSQILWKFRYAVIIGTLVSFVVLAPFIKRVTPDNSVEAVSVINDPNIKLVKKVEKFFGSEEYISIAFKTDDIFSAKSLQLINDFSTHLESNPYVSKVQSITTIWNLKNEIIKGEEGLRVVPFIDPLWLKNGVPEGERKNLLETEFYKTLLYNKDGTAAAILAELTPMDDSEEQENKKSALIADIRKYSDEMSKKTGVEFHVFGWPVLNRSVFETIETENTTLNPLMIVAITLLVVYLYRNFFITLITMAQFVITLAIVMGILGVMGVHFNWLTVFAPSVMMIMSICDAVYIINEFQNADYTKPKWERLRIAFKNIGAPCLFTTVINGFGFASLLTSTIKPLKDFGLYVTVAVIVEYIISFTFFVLLLNSKKAAAKKIFEKKENPAIKFTINKVYNLVIEKPRLVAMACLVLTIGSFIGMTRLETNQWTMNLFRKDSYRLNESNDFIKKEGAGGGAETALMFDTEVEGTLLEPENLKKMEEFQKKVIEKVPLAIKTISLVDFIKHFNQAWHNGDPAFNKIPDTKEEVTQLVVVMEMDKDRLNLERFATNDYSKGLIRIFTTVSSTLKHVRHNFETTDQIVNEVFNDSLRPQLISKSLVLSLIIRDLPSTVIFSIVTSLIFIGLTMMILFRSFYIGVLSLIPSVLPIFMIMGIMGFTGIWINIATAMTFAVSLGIAMDDTINIIWRMKRNVVGKGMTYEAALRNVYDEIGTPLISSSLMLTGGYLMLTFSKIWPTTTFGFFVALCCMLALVSDLLLTPLLLLKFKPFKTKKVAS